MSDDPKHICGTCHHHSLEFCSGPEALDDHRQRTGEERTFLVRGPAEPPLLGRCWRQRDRPHLAGESGMRAPHAAPSSGGAGASAKTLADTPGQSDFARATWQKPKTRAAQNPYAAQLEKIKRPPFAFKTPKALDDAINSLIAAWETGDTLGIDMLQDDVHAQARGITRKADPTGGNEEWIIRYFADNGWMREGTGAGID